MKQSSRAVALCIIFIVTFLAMSSSQAPLVRANPGSDDPQHIHLTYQHSPTSAITVTWQTAQPSTGDIVYYDNVSWGGNSSKYRSTATGSHHTYTGASGYIHDVEFTNLAPNTTYYFICGGLSNYSSERSFRTAPATSTDFRFVAGGDSRTNVGVRTQVSQAMRHFDPSFVLHLADMVDDGNIQSYWDPWFQDVNDNWICDNGHTIPIIPAQGNHEHNATNFYEQFALPGNERWFYYDWGLTLRIIVLDDQATSSQISESEVSWLDDVLNSTPNHMWKIVMFHNNVYYAGGHDDAAAPRQYWVPIFDKYHVDVVFQGHSHYYHRTKPMNQGDVVPSYRNGTIYVTSGGWGAPLTDYIEQSYSAYGTKSYNFVLASVYRNSSLHLEAKDLSGNTFDEVWLRSPLKYWDFQNGMYIRVVDANITQPPILTNENLTLSIEAPTGTNSTTEVYCANRGPPLATSGIASWRYDNSTKVLTATTIHGSQPTIMLLSWLNQSASDDVPPAAIVDLTANNPTVDSITLTWTAPGDDGTTGTALGYSVKYLTIGPITESNWPSATIFAQSWTPQPGGSAETHDITGLNSDTTYWFAIESHDEASNYSPISNSPHNKTVDLVAPTAIADLAASNPTNTSITLTWTAPGDNGDTDTATGYVVKYSTAGAITDSNWNSATNYTQSWMPLTAGSTETRMISGLVANTTYWFAVKAYDEVPNSGGVSNSPSGRTIGASSTTPPAPGPEPPSEPGPGPVPGPPPGPKPRPKPPVDPETEDGNGGVTPGTATYSADLAYALAGILTGVAIITVLALVVHRHRSASSSV